MRTSGAEVRGLAGRHFRSQNRLRPRVAVYGRIVDEHGTLIDRGLALFMKAPHTYTGEDMLEFHLHGNSVITSDVLRALLNGGARLADPGEFTKRAFLNGKLDLHAACSVADLIEAETRTAARAAVANMSSALARRIRELRAELGGVLEELAAAVDFPDEVAEPDRSVLTRAVDGVRGVLVELQSGWEGGRLLREGLGVAIVGPPNAGKSSLLNALLGEERALVSEIPGTTRDTIEESIVLDGVQVRFTDTAGIHRTDDALEVAGIARSRRVLEQSRLLLVVVDGSEALDAAAREFLESTRNSARVVLFNKADVGTSGYAQRAQQERNAISGSVHDAGTLDAVRHEIAQSAWDGIAPDAQRPHLASTYELEAVRAALVALHDASTTLHSDAPTDFAVGDLQTAFAALGRLSGDVANEELLDGIFARFCIGK